MLKRKTALRPHMLIATLGDQAQVVTRALDELLKTHPIKRVTVIHTSEERERSKLSLDRVRAEKEHYDGIEFREVPFRSDGGRALQDIMTQDDAEVVLRVLFRAIREAKLENHVVHLSIAGGRKVVSAYGVVAAQLLCDDHDFCWHLYEGAPRGERNDAMHAAPDEDTVLIPVPILPLSGIAPVLAQLGSDPWQLLDIIKREQEREREARLRAFLTPAHGDKKRLTAAEGEVLRLLCQGCSNQQIAKERGVSLKTVQNNVTKILEKFDAFWDWPKGVPLEDRALIATFAPLLAQDEKENKR